MLAAALLSLALTQTPAEPGKGDALQGLVDASTALGLVAVDPEKDCPGCRWCKRGKPVAKEPIRLAVDSQWRDDSIGRPVATRTALLRERACPAGFVFRIKLIEWSYSTEEEASAAAKAIVKENHNGPMLKRVHRLWRDGKRLYFADAGAFTHWDRFAKVMKKLGIGRGVCDHA